MKFPFIRSIKLKQITYIISVIIFFGLIFAINTIPENYFISWGDFRFQIFWEDFYYKHTYIWSNQNSALNLDGILRAYSRAPLMFVFWLTKSNIITSYFYIIIGSLFNFFVFYKLSEKVLGVQKDKNLLLISLLYTFNPVFLGNLSKIGLSIGTTSLLGLITCLHLMFKKKMIFPYTVYIILLFNISLIHPFHFLVNFGVFALIAVYLIIKNFKFSISKIWQIILSVIIAIITHLYAILTILSARSVDKSVLSNSIGGDASTLDLRELAVTQSFIEGFALSKSIFKDFEFYIEEIKFIYFALFFILLGIVFITNLILIKRKGYAFKASIFIYIFVVLVVLTRGLTLSLTEPFYNLISLTPLSWVFRSPLKWQFYIPLVLYPLIILQISYFQSKKLKLIFPSIIAGILIIVSSTVIYEISAKLIIPKTQVVFDELEISEIKDSHTLLINSTECGDLAQKHLPVYNELQHLLSSYGNTHLALNEDELRNNINLFSNFDYIIGCNENLFNLEITQDRFIKKDITNEYGIVFYKNLNPTPNFFAVKSPYVTDDKINLKSNVLQENTSKTSNTIYSDDKTINSSNQYNQIFDYELESNNFVNNSLNIDVKKDDLISNTFYFDTSYYIIEYEFNEENLLIYKSPIGTLYINGEKAFESNRELIYKTKSVSRFITINDHVVSLRDTGVFGISKNIRSINLLGKDITRSIVDENRTKEYIQFETDLQEDNNFVFRSNFFNFNNLIDNSSFEESEWESGLKDCFSYDEYPDLDLNYIDESNPYIELSAKRHIACTSKNIETLPNTPIFISYKHKSNLKGLYGYSVGLIGGMEAKEKMTEEKNSDWETKNDTVGWGSLDYDSIFRLKVIEGEEKTNNIVNFDDVYAINYPDLNNFVFQKIENDDAEKLNSEISVENINFTSYKVKISGINSSQFLYFKQRYDVNWSLRGKDNLIQRNHFIGDQIFNAWYIDLNTICDEFKCIRNDEGEYSIEFIIEYKSQKIVNYGLIFGSFVFISLFMYLIISHYKSQNKN